MPCENESALWRATPTTWMISTLLFTLLCITGLDIVATLSLFNIPIPVPSSAEALYQTVFEVVTHYPIIVYILWALNGLLAIKACFRYLTLRFENYTLTPHTIHYATGVLNRQLDETALYRIVDIGVEMPLFLRLLGYGHVVIYSNDPSLETSGIKPSIQTPDGRKGVYLAGVKHPVKIKTLISQHVAAERNRKGIRNTEFM